MATKKKAKAAPKAKAKAKAAPKLTPAQLNVLKHVSASPDSPRAAFDRRTLNSLAAKKLIAGAKAVRLTAAGTAYLGAPAASAAA